MPSSVEYIGWGKGAWGAKPLGHFDLTIVSVDGVVGTGSVGTVTGRCRGKRSGNGCSRLQVQSVLLQ